MGFLTDTQNCGLRMRRECREHFPRHRLQMKPLVSGPGIHHGTCVKHVPRCMSGSLTCDCGENVPGIPGACANHNFPYLVRSPWRYTEMLFVSSKGDLCLSFIITVLYITTRYMWSCNNEAPLDQIVGFFSGHFNLLGPASKIVKKTSVAIHLVIERGLLC